MNRWWQIACVPALVFLALGQAAVPASDGPNDANRIEGLWSGPWGGGGGPGGVVFQPVIAELLIQGDRVELVGFPNVGRLTGTVRFNTGEKRMRIVPTVEPGDRPVEAIDFAYQIKNGELTLTNANKVPVTLQQCPVVDNPPANTEVEFVAATGVNEAGDLLVTTFTVLRAGRSGAIYYQPANRSLKTNQATVLLVQERGMKRVTIDEARALIGTSMLVAITSRQDNRPSKHQYHELWKEMGSPTPDSEAVQRTFSRILRPGTLVFVLSARENVPVP